MSDVIPPELADLLRKWRTDLNADADLIAWVDEHLPTDLGPVGPDTPWGSLCRSRYGVEAIFVGASTNPEFWVGEALDGTIAAYVYDGWRVVRSGPPEPGPLGGHR